jgi:transposase
MQCSPAAASQELKETVDGKERPLIQTLVALLQQAISLAERREELTPAGYERRVRDIEQRFEAWQLKLIRKHERSPELERLLSHIMKHFDEWLLFLREPQVSATNNHAERMLRPAVITRKVGGCNKTLRGALVHSILASLMVTCQQQGRRFLDLAKRLWQQDDPQAIPLQPPSERTAEPA